MSVWKNVKNELPPVGEKVLILFKDKKDELNNEHLFYEIAKAVEIYNGKPIWSTYTEYQGYYEVVFWTPLVDMPRIVKD